MLLYVDTAWRDYLHQLDHTRFGRDADLIERKRRDYPPDAWLSARLSR